MKTLILNKLTSLLFVFLLLFMPVVLQGQNTGADNPEISVETLSNQIYLLIGSSRYEEALELLEKGKILYPASPIFYEISGELFTEKELYKIALNEYLEAEKLYKETSQQVPGSVIQEIAELYGYLNRNDDALSYFEELLKIPDFRDEARRRLSWMYFKTSRLDEGIEKIEMWLEEGFDADLAHSLGVIYSSKYDYENSFKNYTKAIDYAEKNGFKYFASIAYYNLSLLELSFYRFEESYKYAEKSLDLVDRPNGYMGRANISILKMDLDKTKEDLLSAKSTLEHPIPLLELTDLYLLFGAYQNASATLAEIELWKDSSWMYYFGYNKISYALALNELYYTYYSGLYYLEKTRIPENFGDRFKRRGHLIKFRINRFYYKVRKRNFEKAHAKEKRKTGNYFDSDISEYSRSEGYRYRSEKYLKRMEDFETKRIPLSIPHYKKEWGTVIKSKPLLEESINELSPVWEKQIICEAYKELILLYNKDKDFSARQKTASLLYKINPGGLRQYGILLPLSVDFTLSGSETRGKKKKNNYRKFQRKTKRLIKKTGTEIISDGSPSYSLKLFYNIKEQENETENQTDKNSKTNAEILFYLFDEEENLLLFGSENLKNSQMLKTGDLAGVINKIFRRIYTSESQGSPLY